MEESEHKYHALTTLEFLADRVINYKTGRKYVTYGELAIKINYPTPHIGDLFSNNISMTLHVMGDMINDEVPVEAFKIRIPHIQTLVVNGQTKLPGDGYGIFFKEYKDLNIEQKREFIEEEYEQIFEFGKLWEEVYEYLLKNDSD